MGNVTFPLSTDIRTLKWGQFCSVGSPGSTIRPKILEGASARENLHFLYLGGVPGEYSNLILPQEAIGGWSDSTVVRTLALHGANLGSIANIP